MDNNKYPQTEMGQPSRENCRRKCVKINFESLFMRKKRCW